LLALQVKYRLMPAEAAELLPPLYAAHEVMPSLSDELLGTVHLDLSPLAMLGSLDGWYNIVNEHKIVKGQLKVSMQNLQNSVCLCLLLNYRIEGELLG
jgi:hypothetical protein